MPSGKKYYLDNRRDQATLSEPGAFPKHSVSELVRAYEKSWGRRHFVVTEPTLFDGSRALLQEVRRQTKLPILRKDFITTVSQIEETGESWGRCRASHCAPA